MTTHFLTLYDVYNTSIPVREFKSNEASVNLGYVDMQTEDSKSFKVLVQFCHPRFKDPCNIKYRWYVKAPSYIRLLRVDATDLTTFLDQREEDDEVIYSPDPFHKFNMEHVPSSVNKDQLHKLLTHYKILSE